MTTATETAYQLTAQDIKALKTADRVTFSYSRTSDDHGIRAIKQVKNPGPFEDGEREHPIPTQHQFSGYGHQIGSERNNDTPRRCFTLQYHYDCHLRSIISILKPGDELTLHWLADAGQNGYVRGARTTAAGHVDAPLHADRLDIIIHRKNTRLHFVIDTSICPDNDARMIRF